MKLAGILTVLWALILGLMSCENDIKTVEHFSVKDTLPLTSAKNIELIYSDSGRIQFKLISPLLNQYNVEDQYYEFPKGLTLYVYDTLLQIKSTLKANYAISWEKRNLMEAKNDVVIVNKEDIINTEHIVWNKRTRSIYSDVFVKRTNKDGVMYGDGFDADETFNKYSIRNPRGTFSVQQ